MPKMIRVLIVEDSAFMRKLTNEILSSDPNIEVVGQAKNGTDALQKLAELKPDVITMDVEMPILDGVGALTEIMSRQPTPVIMLSSLTQAGAEVTLRCLKLGAVDFISKPSGSISLDLSAIAPELISKVRLAAQARLSEATRERVRIPARPVIQKTGGIDLFMIGSSTGGPKALHQVIPRLPKNLGVPGVIVQHLPEMFTKMLASRLNDESELTVREAEEGDVLTPGTVLLAPGGQHLEFSLDGKARLTQAPPVHGTRPAVDVTLASLIKLYGPRMVSILLTGMGRDGAMGMKALHDLGGETIAEDPSTCVIYGMPKAAADLGAVRQMLPLPEIAGAITHSVKSRLLEAC